MEDTALEQIDYLKMIEYNTRAQITRIEDLLRALGEQISNLPPPTPVEPTSPPTTPIETPQEKMVNDAYLQILRRMPDQSGLNYWVKELDTGVVNASNLKSSILTGAVAFGEISLDEYIRQIYKWGLGRMPTSEDIAYWVGAYYGNKWSYYELLKVIKAAATKAGEHWTPFADGGIVTSPTKAIIGEAGYNEAVIPLKNPDDPFGTEEIIKELQELRKEVIILRNDNNKNSSVIQRNTEKSRFAS